MEKYQEDYIKLIEGKFRVVGKPKRVTYNRIRNIVDDGILVELDSTKFEGVCVFLSNNIRNVYHKWAMELESEHLPKCVWLTRYTDPALKVPKGFFI